MSDQAGIAALAQVWDLLPTLVGPDWREFEPELLDALTKFAEVGEPEAGQVLDLCARFPALRRALERAVQAQDSRSEQTGGTVPSWAETAEFVAGVVEKAARPPGDRWLVADLNEDLIHAGETYELTIAVDTEPAALAAERVATGQPERQLTVSLSGVGAQVEALANTLTLPPEGASPDQARFRVTPMQTGRVRLSALVYGQDFFQELKISLIVGDAPSKLTIRAQGLPIDAGTSYDAYLVLTGEKMLLIDNVVREAPMPSTEQLQLVVARAHEALYAVVNYSARDGHAFYQEALQIPAEAHDWSSGTLVRAGYLMYNDLFFGVGAPEELRVLGSELAELAKRPDTQRFVVVSAETFLPWQLLAFTPNARVEELFGLKHQISRLPMQANNVTSAPERRIQPHDGEFRVVLAVNHDIDRGPGQQTRSLVQGQLDDWRARATKGALAVQETDDFLDLLARDVPPAEILYLFCHAYFDHRRRGPTRDALIFKGDHRVSLDDLISSQQPGFMFAARPLVVLNACSTAVVEPGTLQGFMPHLLSRGARGVIGTHGDVPAVFAAAWAGEFFALLLAGASVGEAVLTVNQTFLRRDRNLLGLLYTAHCDGDTRLDPPPLVDQI